jgi:hypothetical protein
MSALTTLLMLPFIGIAMWLIDRAGRRYIFSVIINLSVLAPFLVIRYYFSEKSNYTSL